MFHKFIIYGDPVVKKNNRPIYFNKKTGKPFLGKTKKLVEAEKSALRQLFTQKIDTITTPVTAAFKVYTRTRRKIDLSNAVQLYEDALQAAEILENDALIRSPDGTRQYLDRVEPRVEIIISDFVDLEEGECIL